MSLDGIRVVAVCRENSRTQIGVDNGKNRYLDGVKRVSKKDQNKGIFLFCTLHVILRPARRVLGRRCRLPRVHGILANRHRPPPSHRSRFSPQFPHTPAVFGDGHHTRVEFKFNFHVVNNRRPARAVAIAVRVRIPAG